MKQDALSTRMRRASLWIAPFVCILLLASNIGRAQEVSPEDTEYYVKWVEAAAALAEFTVVAEAINGQATTEQRLALKDFYHRFDVTIGELLETTPPVEDVERYLVVLPVYRECVSAAHALAQSAEQGDLLEIEMAREWYTEALERLRTASARFSTHRRGAQQGEVPGS